MSGSADLHEIEEGVISRAGARALVEQGNAVQRTTAGQRAGEGIGATSCVINRLQTVGVGPGESEHHVQAGARQRQTDVMRTGRVYYLIEVIHASVEELEARTRGVVGGKG